MKKSRVFILLAVFFCLVTALCVTAGAATRGRNCGSNVTWSLEAGKLVISGTGKMWDYSTYSSVPWYNFNDSIKTITIGDGVTRIGDYAFSTCSKSTTVAIPASVTSIGSDAFSYCHSLTSVTIPDSVTSIGSAAFSYCSSLTSVTIPDSVTSIGINAFYDCTSLTTITIPDSVTSIGDEAFSGCTGLQNTDGNLIYIKTTDNPYFYLQDTTSETITSCSVNSNTRFIGNEAFWGCSLLTTVTIPDSVTSIGYRAFASCSSLTSITIPDSVTSIGSSAFASCSSLTSVTIPDSIMSIGSSAFSYCSSLTTITIPDSVTSIGSSAFYDCTSLTTITIPDSVTSIGDEAFSGCTGLQNTDGNLIYIKTTDNPYFYLQDTTSETITSCSVNSNTRFIGNSAFASCSSLTSVTIPDSIMSIGSDAFSYCSSLTTITIPDSVTSIGDKAFFGCTGLQNTDGNLIYIKTTDNPYFYLLDTTSVTITSCSVNSNTRFIGDHAFSGCRLLRTVTIPDSVTSIGRSAFSDCISLTSVTIPDSVTSIGFEAFYNCSSLTTVTIPDSVTSIGGYAFCSCSSLTTVTIPDSVTSIGSKAFYNCPNLTIYGYTGSYAETYANANSIPFVALTQLTLVSKTAAVYKNNTAAIRFIVKLSLAENAVVENYGILLAQTTEQARVKAVILTDAFEGSVTTYAVDLVGIPQKDFDTEIYAWAFVKLVGVEEKIVLPISAVRVNSVLSEMGA